MATVNLQVGASADDATEFASDQSVNIVGAFVGLAIQNNWGGFRFQIVSVPQGSTINSATFSLKATHVAYDDAHFTAFGEDISDAPAFQAQASNITNRTPTTANVEVDADSVGTDWYAVTVTTIVQEIVNRGTWSSGNDLAILLRADASANLRVNAYDGTAAAAAKLDIEYTITAAFPPVPGAVHRQRRFPHLRM